MKKPGKGLIACVSLLALLAGSAHAQTVAQGFTSPPDNARPMVRWWWFGSAVTDAELKREIGAMKQGGFGGFEIQPVYPLALDDPKTGFHNQAYLSDGFLNSVKFANDTGRAEGMRVDMTLGSGWPYGGPHIAPTEASAKLVANKVVLPAKATTLPLPKLGAGENIVAVFVAEGSAAAPDIAHAVMVPSGQTAIAPADHDRALLILGEARTGQQVKRAGVGAEGPVLDHMNAAAVQHHLKVVGEPILKAFGDHPPYAVFSDSLEVYSANWTDDLLAEFQKRRGYDLAPHLLDLFYDGANSPAIRHDWSLTLSELTDERYLTPINDWAKAHATRFRSQTYGIPPVTMSSNARVTLPEGEGPQWRKFSTTRWASSANHLYGQPVTSAESWTWLHAGAFRSTPLDIKAEADTMMLEGVNQFIAHGWPYTPPGTPEPGWAFYAAAVFNDHNPWWPVMPDVTKYLQRMSYLLRQGDNVADVAIFLPDDDAFAGMKPTAEVSVNGKMGQYVTDGLTAQVLDAGYNFDYVDNGSINTLGIKAKVLILPHVSRIDPDVYKKINAFARAGGIVIAVDSLPDKGAGFLDGDVDTQSVRMTSGELFGPGVGSGKQVAEAELGKTLAGLTPADLTKPVELGFVHRHLKDGDLYFVANTSNHAVTADLGFRAAQKHGQWWDARSGQAHAFSGGKVTLAAYESRVFVFGKAASAPVVAEPKAGKAARLDLSQGWQLSLDGKDKTVNLPNSWADDPATKDYSGVASYKRTLTLTNKQIKAGQTVLDFGEGTALPAPTQRQNGTMALLEPPVREAAEVFVNGKRAGSVWTAPFTVDLQGFVHAGSNTIEVRVANTAINLLASRPPADYTALTAKYGERFQAQNMNNLKPLPSGIVHAVSLETPK